MDETARRTQSATKQAAYRAENPDEAGSVLPAPETVPLARRNFLRLAGGTGLATVVCGPLLAACGSSDTASKSQDLNLRLEGDISSLDPAFEPTNPNLFVNYNIFENLVSFKPGSFQLVNTLAETWEPAKDGLSYDFTLKKGIAFHGGYGELTTEDVKFSFERIAGLTTPPISSIYKKNWGALKEVKVTGRYSGTILFSVPFAPLMTLTIPGGPGMVVSKRAVQERGKRFGLHPIGTGPYEFVRWTPQQEVLLKKFGKYSGAARRYARPVEWKQIKLQPITSPSTAVIGLQNGTLDFGAIPLESISTFKNKKEFSIVEQSTLGYSWIGMNTGSPKLKNRSFREALRYAIDVPSMIQGAFNGAWPQANAIIPPTMPLGHWSEAPSYAANPAKARQLLKQIASYPDKLTLAYDSSDTGAQAVAEIVQANLKDVGVTVAVSGEQTAVIQALGAGPQGKRELFYIHFNTQPDPAQSMQWFTCDEINTWNFMNWCDPNFTKLAQKGTTTVSKAQRSQLYVEMQKIWDKDINSVWVAWPSVYFAARQGIKPSLYPDGRFIAWDFRSAGA